VWPGFFGSSSSAAFRDANAGPWVAANGVDFYRNHVGADIDFATQHIYTDFWWPSDSWNLQLDHFRKWNAAHALVRIQLYPLPPLRPYVSHCRSSLRPHQSLGTRLSDA
jgi:hypothetical protein